MIRKSYSFSAREKCKSSGFGIDARCVFFGNRHSVNELQFFDELEAALAESETLPDCIVLLAHPHLASVLQSHWCNSSQRQSFIERGMRNGRHYVKDYTFFSWDAQNLMELPKPADIQTDHLFDLPVDLFIEQGLHQLIRENPVVQIAPAGHVFKHPSGTINKVFIQTRELAKSEPELSFISHALCMAARGSLTPELTIVYVDTMSIYSLVREALDVAGLKARISSFHSYDDLSRFSPPSEPYLVVISASTTGGMARRLHKQNGFDKERLITIIDASKTERSGVALIALDEVDESYNRELSGGTETEIELVGEHFSSKAKPPRAVTLGQLHMPKDLMALLKFFGIHGIEGINEGAHFKNRPRTICLKPEAIDSTTKFQEWIQTEIRWNVSAAVDHIIHTDDAGSFAIAKRASTILKQAKGNNIAPVVTSYSDVNSQSLVKANGVLVVTALAGDGGLLREISRDLRELIKPELPRHFLVGVGLPQTEEAWIRLRQFLERNTTHRPYGFSSWLLLPIGPDGSDNAWEDLSNLASQAQLGCRRPGILPQELENAALNQFSETAGVAYNGFFPNNASAPLGLSDGFLFFGDVFKGKPLITIPNATTCLAISSVLQAARDLKNPNNQLRPTGYESVVLSPENFLRFNDNLLQACLLRLAHPSELDYSASPNLSTLMKEFLSKVFQRQEHPYGAAALEFAAALATGRLKLKKADTQELVNTAINNLKSNASVLLGILLMVGK